MIIGNIIFYCLLTPIRLTKIKDNLLKIPRFLFNMNILLKLMHLLKSYFITLLTRLVRTTLFKVLLSFNHFSQNFQIFQNTNHYFRDTLLSINIFIIAAEHTNEQLSPDQQERIANALRLLLNCFRRGVFEYIKIDLEDDIYCYFYVPLKEFDTDSFIYDNDHITTTKTMADIYRYIENKLEPRSKTKES